MADDELIRRLRLGDLQRLIRFRWGCVLPDDDAGLTDLIELLFPLSLGRNPEERMQRATEIWAPWLCRKETEEAVSEVNKLPVWQRKPDADLLGKRMRYTI